MFFLRKKYKSATFPQRQSLFKNVHGLQNIAKLFSVFTAIVDRYIVLISQRPFRMQIHAQRTVIDIPVFVVLFLLQIMCPYKAFGDLYSASDQCGNNCKSNASSFRIITNPFERILKETNCTFPECQEGLKKFLNFRVFHNKKCGKCGKYGLYFKRIRGLW